jgi:protein-S-isoprenylcysteine O-methyltransferase Ste14
VHAVAVIIAVVWILFWIFWIASAAGAKPGRTMWGRFAGVRVAIVVVVIILVRLHVFKGSALTTSPWLEGIGLAMFLSGLALALWARRHLGRNWGMPMSEKVDPELVTTGPYSGVRHPIYSGLLLAMVGTSVAVSGYWLIAGGLLAGYFVFSAVNEERYMASRFPDTYPAYKSSTKMLVPFLF